MDFPIHSRLTLGAGSLFMLVGIFLPSSAVIESMRTAPNALREQLILGATLFRIGLVLNGLWIITSGWMIPWKPGSQNRNSLSCQQRAYPPFLLLGILLTAFLLRLYNLDAGIWYDEIVNYVSYMDRSLGEILTTYDSQNNHLLYTLLARVSFFIFGESVWSFRLPAVLFGLGSIWALYLFACHVATRREGLLAAALLTLSYHHIWFSQNARGYTALLFWTMVSSLFLVRALREARLDLWLMYGLTTSLGVFTHLTMLFVVVGQGVVFLHSVYLSAEGDRREKWLSGVLGFAAAGLLSFQLYALVLPQLLNWGEGGVGPWQGKVDVTAWKSPIWMLLEIAAGMNISLGSSILVLVAFLVFVAGLIDFARTELSVVYLVVVPVLVSLTVMVGMGSTLLPRFFFFSMGFAALIIIRGLMFFGELTARLKLRFIQGQKLGTVLCITMIAVSAISIPRAYLPKQDYTGALQFIQETRRPGDVVVTVGLAVFPYQRFYKVDWHQVATLEELDKVRSRGGRTWLVYTMPIVLKSANPEIMKSIQVDFEAVKEFPGTLNGGNILVALAKS